MVKTLRTYTINSDLIEKLKDYNASELINTLLIDYFKKHDYKQMSLEEKKKYLKKLKLTKEYKEQIEKLEHD